MSASAGPPQLLTPRNVVTFFATFFFLLAIVVGDGRFLLLASILLSVLLLAIFDAWPLLGSIEVKRTHPGRVFRGSVLPVELAVESKGGRSPELVLIEDSVPASSAYRQRRLVALPRNRNQSLILQFFPSCDHRRGFYILGPVRIEATDAYGFFRRIEVVDEMTELVVYPEASELSQFPVLGEGTLEHVGLEIIPKRGVSEELFGTRDYLPGDPLRRVHWKLSARHDRLMVKEFEEELTTVVTVFLDLGRLGLSGVGDHTSVEYGIHVGASVLRRTMELGHRFQYFGVAGKVDHVGVGAGQDHLLTILDRLAFAKADGGGTFPIVVGDLLPTLPYGSTIILIFGYTSIQPDKVLDLVLRCQQRWILPIVLMVDDRSFIKLFREQEEQHARAVMPEDLVRQLEQQGARAAVIRRGSSIAEAVSAALQPKGSVASR